MTTNLPQIVTSLPEIAKKAILVHGAMQKESELAILLALAQALDPKVIWEIGTATGGTLWALCMVTKPEMVLSIDLPGGPWSGGATIEPQALGLLLKDAGIEEEAVYVAHGRSQDVWLPQRAPNLLLIDGDHSRRGVAADFKRYEPLVADGGVIVLHDICEHPKETGVQVSKFWVELQASGRSVVEIVDTRAAHWGGLGVLFK